MKFRQQQPVERRVKAARVLKEPSQEKTLLESLDFIKTGDLGLLETIALNWASEERDKRTAFALPGLLFSDRPTGAAFREERSEFMTRKKDDFELMVTSRSDVFEERQSLSDVLKAAEGIFLLRSLVPGEVAKPSEEAWKVIDRQVEAASRKENSSPANWLAKLMYVDPVRFKALPPQGMRLRCLHDIAQERVEYPASKDKRQIRLLNALANTRLMFPDMVDSASLSTEERAVTRAYLESQRACARDEAGSGFAFYLYLLSIVGAPGLKVDEKGVHLLAQQTLGNKPVDLPLRSIV